MKITLTDAQNRYGPLGSGVWPAEVQWCSSYLIPTALNLINSLGTRQMHVYCNKDMEPALDQAFQNVIARGLAAELETFDGCFMVRDVRAEPGKPSCHSYALAIDLNAAKNPLGGEPTFSDALVKCFTDAGFSWGGNFTRKDGMHFSYAWE